MQVKACVSGVECLACFMEIWNDKIYELNEFYLETRIIK